MNLNRSELITGTIVAYLVTFWTGWVAIPLALLSGLFWALSGRGDSKLWRRLGVPAIIVVQLAIHTGFYWGVLSIPAAWGTLTLGYGTPQGDDNPSALGAFFWKLTDEDALVTDILTRGSIVLMLYGVIFAPFLIRMIYQAL